MSRPLLLLLALGSACASSSEPADGPMAAGSGCEQRAPATEALSVESAFGALHGTLQLPAGCGPFPAVLLIAGSGTTNRDGNGGASLQTNTYRQLADGLSARGIASLRYDKAGVGASAAAIPAVEELRLETYADGAALFLAALRAHSAVSRSLVAGHSEGSLLGMLAARQVGIAGFVSLAGAGRTIGAVLREQLAAQLSGPLLDQCNAILSELEAGRTVLEVPSSPPSLAALFSLPSQLYLISWMQYDPAAELARLDAPALIVQGSTDIQVSTADALLLAMARPDAQLLIIEGMNHVLKAAALEPEAQQAAYTDPRLPVVPELIEALAAFALP